MLSWVLRATSPPLRALRFQDQRLSMNEPKICPAGGMQGGQVTERWDSNSTQVAREKITLCVYQFYFVLCVYIPVAYRGQKRCSHALELVLSNYMELGIKPRSSANTASALSH